LPRETVMVKLPLVVQDAALIDRLSLAMDAYYSLTIAEHERALVHGDLGLHNMAFDPGSHDANGIFDYGDAAWADRHHDFRYLMFGAVQDTLLDATMRAYTLATGFELTRRRILLYNAACAIGHLADRAGFDPNEPISGRTLAQDLVWTQWALKRSGF
jgi:aminoglycoside phosphotransferase (APT) family kinase protein